MLSTVWGPWGLQNFVHIAMLLMDILCLHICVTYTIYPTAYAVSYNKVKNQTSKSELISSRCALSLLIVHVRDICKLYLVYTRSDSLHSNFTAVQIELKPDALDF